MLHLSRVLPGLLLLTSCGSSDDGAQSADGGSSADVVVADTSSATDGGTLPDSDAASGADADTDASLPVGFRAFRFVNRCATTVWVASLGNPITPKVACTSDAQCAVNQACNPASHQCTWVAPGGGGWQLDAMASRTLAMPPSWAGRFWPRTGCAQFNTQGTPACATGDCAGKLACDVGVGGAPPATLAEFTLIPPTAPVGIDFYDVSAVDGANIAVRIAPLAGTFAPTAPSGTNATYYCGSPGCTSGCGALGACAWNLATTCPQELRDIVGGAYVGCKSANQVCAVDPTNVTLACAVDRDLYACTPGGPHAVSGSCYSANADAKCCGCPSWSPAGACKGHDPGWEAPSRPEKYAAVFKTACPTAYSFPYDDPTSTFTCRGTASANVGYEITFCP